MATLSRSIRRGLPRVEGGDPWPAAGEAPARIVTAGASGSPVGVCFRGGTGHRRASGRRALRPPLPLPRKRHRGGVVRSGPCSERTAPRWRGSFAAACRACRAASPGRPRARFRYRGGAPVRGSRRRRHARAGHRCCCCCCCRASSAGSDVACSCSGPTAAPAGPTTGTTPLRRGLPRVPGGEPWPPAGLAPAAAAAPAVQAAPEPLAQAPAPAPASWRPWPRRSHRRPRVHRWSPAVTAAATRGHSRPSTGGTVRRR